MASSIQLLRSTNPQERPFAGNLLEGQPAVNLHQSEPGLFFKASDGSIVKFGPATITSDGSPPNSSPTGSSGNSTGELWLDKSVDPPVLKVYDGAAWIEAGSGGGGGGTSSFVRWIYTATGGETSLSGTSGGVLLAYEPGLEEVFVNGVLITRGSDYSAINGTSITNLVPLTAGDVVTVISLTPQSIVQLPGQATLLRWTVLASAGQTTLSGVDAGGQQLSYTPNFEEVFVNGAFLRRGTDYTATSGTTIVLSAPLALNDEVTVVAFSQFDVGNISASDISGQLPAAQVDFSRRPGVVLTADDKFREYVSVTDYGAVGDGVTDDTAAIQAALDDFTSPGIRTLFFPKATYAVTKLIIRYDNASFKSFYFNGSTLRGIATTPTNAVLQINARNLYIEDLNIVSDFNTNYTSAIHWYSAQPGRPAEWIHINKLYLQYFIIGILFGQLEGDPVIDAPQSENYITHANFRGVQNNIYCRQPNGFIFFDSSTMDCAPYEWSFEAPGVFNATAATVATNLGTILQFSNCELLKTFTQLGRCIYTKGSTGVNGCTIESAATNFEVGGGALNIVGVVTAYFSNAQSPFISCEANTFGDISIVGLNLSKPQGAVNANMPVIDLNGNKDYSVSCSDSRFENQLLGNIISIKTSTDAINCFTGAVQFSNCRAYYELSRNSSMTLLNTTGPNTFPDLLSFDLSDWTVSSTGGATAGVVDTANGQSVLTLTGATANFVIATTQPVPILDYGRYVIVGFDHRFTGSGFAGQLVANFYTKNSAGVFVSRGTQQLSVGQGVGSIAPGSATSADFVRDQFLVRIPKDSEYTHMSIRFGLQTAGTYEIKGITIR